MRTETIESIATVGNRTTEGGAAVGFLGWLLSSQAIGLIGLLVAALGLFVTWYYRREADRDFAPVTVYGAIGAKTIAAYAALEKRRGRIKACELTMKLLEGYQTAHYTTLAKGQANSSFLVGWVDNRIGNVPLARCAESVATVKT